MVFNFYGYVDAMPLIKALAAASIMIPQENSFLLNLLWLADHLRSGLIRSLSWTDTRDMLADGMTKGAIDRKDLHEVMAGNIRILHDTIRLWRPSTRQVLKQ